MSGWSELFHAKASIYALDDVTKQWTDRGTSGIITMFLHTQFQSDIRIKWTKNSRELWWKLMGGRLKPKGERAWVLKAWETSTNQQEILAVRFSDQKSSQIFAKKYNKLFPEQPIPIAPQQYIQSFQPYQPNNFGQGSYPLNVNINANRINTQIDKYKQPQSA
eukprot:315610_1